MLSGDASREMIVDEMVLGALARPEIGADGRLISVGISAALFCVVGVRREAGRRDRGIPDDQVAMAANHASRFAASRNVKRFKDADDEALALRSPA